MLDGYGRVCAGCGCVACEVHHIRPREYGGTDHPRNLIPLCRECHDQIHREIDGQISLVFEPVTVNFIRRLKYERG